MAVSQNFLSLILLYVILTATSAHQSIAFPTPISFLLDCRMGNKRNCPGPCPNIHHRKDQDPKNPKVTVKRGQILGVKVRKNNHIGGFARWSIVKLRHMNSHRRHRRSAFYYTCGDHRVTRCKYNEREYCDRDETNQYYQYYLRIPNVYPNGFYVLGFAWFGGLFSNGKAGFFGDYYDCMYLRIKGGKVKGFHKPTFYPYHSTTGKDGMCKATVNKLGPCRVEPCKEKGRRWRRANFMIPAEFSKEGGPEGLSHRDFK